MRLTEDQKRFYGEAGFVAIDEVASVQTVLAMRRRIEELCADWDSAEARAVGVQQEGFRPYYLLTNILITLLSEPHVDGAAALACLTPEQTAHLGVILPPERSPTVFNPFFLIHANHRTTPVSAPCMGRLVSQ